MKMCGFINLGTNADWNSRQSLCSEKNVSKSNHEQQTILACSAINSSSSSIRRSYLSDQRPWNDQFRPRSMILSTVRISVVQVMNVFTYFYLDQFEEMNENQRKVDEGLISEKQAEMIDKIWEEDEWKKRFNTEKIKNRIYEAIFRYQVTTIFMRSMEALTVKKLGDKDADPYLIDPMSEARRKFDDPSYPVVKSKYEVAKEMGVVCIKANLLSFMADYLYLQIKLAYTMFYKDSKEGKSKTRQLVFYKTSLKLAATRTIGLFMSCFGACLGTMLLPPGGIGVLLGSNVGDNLACSIFED